MVARVSLSQDTVEYWLALTVLTVTQPLYHSVHEYRAGEKATVSNRCWYTCFVCRS